MPRVHSGVHGRKSRARSFICVNYAGSPHKLSWLNEDAKGVYIGLFGEAGGAHFSYHADGTKHFKLPNSSSPLQEHQGTPIDDIDPFQQMLYQRFRFPDVTKPLAEVYRKQDQSSYVGIFLDGSILDGKDLAIAAFIVKGTKEPEFVKFLYSRIHTNGARVIVCNIHTLEHFPQHKIALTILGQ